MIDNIVAIYVFIDEILKEIRHLEDKNRKMNDAEVLTTAIVAAYYFGGHIDKARIFMHATKLVPSMLDKSRYNRRLHAIGEKVGVLLLEIGQRIKQITACREFIVDSFPVAICDNIRISRSKMIKGETYRGYTASMRRYFYGIKVQLVTTDNGIPVEFTFTAGSKADIRGLEQLPLSLAKGSKLYGDAAYTNYHIEDMLKEEGIHLATQRRSNSKRADQPWVSYIKEHMRKRIESTISGIKALFLRKIHAVTLQGFLIKILLFLLAFQLNKAIL